MKLSCLIKKSMKEKDISLEVKSRRSRIASKIYQNFFEKNLEKIFILKSHSSFRKRKKSDSFLDVSHHEVTELSCLMNFN